MNKFSLFRLIWVEQFHDSGIVYAFITYHGIGRMNKQCRDQVGIESGGNKSALQHGGTFPPGAEVSL